MSIKHGLLFSRMRFPRLFISPFFAVLLVAFSSPAISDHVWLSEYFLVGPFSTYDTPQEACDGVYKSAQEYYSNLYLVEHGLGGGGYDEHGFYANGCSYSKYSSPGGKYRGSSAVAIYNGGCIKEDPPQRRETKNGTIIKYVKEYRGLRPCEGNHFEPEYGDVPSCDSKNIPIAFNPINCATGRKYEPVTDISTGGDDAVTYTRTYVSPDPETGASSADPSLLWEIQNEPTLSFKTLPEGVELAILQQGRKFRRVFVKAAGSWHGNGYFPGSELRVSGDIYTYTSDSGLKLSFNSTGQALTRGHKTGGDQYFYEYALTNGVSKLKKISNRFGRYLEFQYDSNNRINSVNDHAGVAVTYSYDDLGNLVEAIYPDETPETESDNPRKTYLYENTNLPHHLTGIIDENNNRYATFTYDEATGKAIRSEHFNGAERGEVTYVGENESLVKTYRTDTDFVEERFIFEKNQGIDKLIERAVIQCANCMVGTEQWVYDNKGRVTQYTDRNGVVSTYTYYSNDRLRYFYEAKGTPQERLTTYLWNNTHGKVSKITTPTEYIYFNYDGKGNLLTKRHAPK